jgi:hypothetical protein
VGLNAPLTSSMRPTTLWCAHAATGWKSAYQDRNAPSSASLRTAIGREHAIVVKRLVKLPASVEGAISCSNTPPVSARRRFLAWVFAPVTGTALDESNVWKAFNRLLEAADLDCRGPHQMRHTFASLLLQHGVPITYVSHQLGHRDASITLRLRDAKTFEILTISRSRCANRAVLKQIGATQTQPAARRRRGFECPVGWGIPRSRARAAGQETEGPLSPSSAERDVEIAHGTTLTSSYISETLNNLEFAMHRRSVSGIERSDQSRPPTRFRLGERVNSAPHDFACSHRPVANPTQLPALHAGRRHRQRLKRKRSDTRAPAARNP